MGGRGGSSSNNGGGVQSIPAPSRKMIQSLKEIVNCPEPEIYAMLKECNMDPNETVNRLLSQDPFHEVKSKREKKKEKDTTESRSRGGVITSNRGVRGGSGVDRYVGRGGSTQLSYSETGALHGKTEYKKEIGTNNYTSLSFPASEMPGHDVNYRPPAHSDSASTENKASSPVTTVDGILSSSSQPSSGYHPGWSGVPGQVSMADIVKMGRPQGKASNSKNPTHYGVNHHHVQAHSSDASHHSLNTSDNYLSDVSESNLEPGVGTGQHVSPNDEWPLLEQPPAASLRLVLEPVPSELQADASRPYSGRTSQYPESEKDEVGAVEDDGIQNIDSNQAEPADASLFNGDMHKSTSCYLSHTDDFDCQEVEDIGVSVSSVTSNLQQLSVLEDHGMPPEEDNASVIIPNHLQVQSADCSHLSFGSFRSGIGASFSGPFLSRAMEDNMEKKSADTDPPSFALSDTRNTEFYLDGSCRTASDGNLVHRTGISAGSYDSPSTSQSEVLKLENSEAPHENQYTFPSSSSNYNFENDQQLNAEFYHSQTSSQIQNLAPFSSQAYTDSLSSSLLAANSQPARDSDLPYLPFPMAQSMATKYGNTMSSITGSTISIPEALKMVSFSSTHPTAQNPSGSIATGPALPQHLSLQPYSQPTLPLGPFANMIGYPFVPQNYTYLPSAYQQTFAGNSTYHQSLAAMLPQYKNSISVSSLPQSAAVASGYGGFGSSTNIPGNYPMNLPTAPGAATVGYDDILSSQYKDSNHLISLQQNENSPMWVHGPGSRSMSAVPASTYYSFQGQGQQPSGFRQSQQPSQNYGALGYPNYYHSQSGISLEHQQQQQQNPRDGHLGGSQGQPSKQSQQIWQNSY